MPKQGLWHVYADGVATGLGQQVMRFELPVGTAAPGRPPSAPTPTGLVGLDGRYGVGFDAMPLKSGQESEVGLHLLHDGKPARDVTPYLGVAAHAVFVDAADLTYVHAHAAELAGAGHDMAGTMPGMAMAAPLSAGAAVSPDLTLHIKVPKAGTYVLWVQFDGGGRVRTVPFVVSAT